MFDSSVIAVSTILGMAIATYATRIGGYWMLGQFEATERFHTWLGYIPTAVFVSLIAPEIARGGPPEWTAGLAVLLIAVRTGNLLYAMVARVGVVFIFRHLLIL